MVSCPLLTSLTFLCAATPFGRAAKRGLRGLGSVRRFAFGTLSGPEFPLRKPPRITVRGQTVQGACLVLRKAPLPSSAVSWSTKRHCGPLAFRRATKGSRVQRKVWGVKRGQETILGVLSPFVSAGRPRHPRPPKAAIVHAHLERKVASTGCAAGSAENLPSALDKAKRALIACGGKPPERRKVNLLLQVKPFSGLLPASAAF